MDTTYRLCIIGDYSPCRSTGLTAATPELAKLVGGQHIIQSRGQNRLGVERCEWRPNDAQWGAGKHVDRLTLVEAESYPGEWTIGS